MFKNVQIIVELSLSLLWNFRREWLNIGKDTKQQYWGINLVSMFHVREIYNGSSFKLFSYLDV